MNPAWCNVWICAMFMPSCLSVFSNANPNERAESSEGVNIKGCLSSHIHYPFLRGIHMKVLICKHAFQLSKCIPTYTNQVLFATFFDAVFEIKMCANVLKCCLLTSLQASLFHYVGTVTGQPLQLSFRFQMFYSTIIWILQVLLSVYPVLCLGTSVYSSAQTVLL